MSSRMRAILFAAVPTLVALLGGLVWFQRKKRPAHQLDYPKPPDKQAQVAQTQNKIVDQKPEKQSTPVAPVPKAVEPEMKPVSEKQEVQAPEAVIEEVVTLAKASESLAQPVSEKNSPVVAAEKPAEGESSNSQPQDETDSNIVEESIVVKSGAQDVMSSQNGGERSHTSWGEEMEKQSSVENILNNNTRSSTTTATPTTKEGSCAVTVAIEAPVSSDSCQGCNSSSGTTEPNPKSRSNTEVSSENGVISSEAAKLEVEVTQVTSQGRAAGTSRRGDRNDSASVESPQSVSSASSHESASDIHSEMSSDSGKASSIADGGALSPVTSHLAPEPEPSTHQNDHDSGHKDLQASSHDPSAQPEIVTYEFDMPSDLCGMFIGRRGSSINLLKQKTSVDIAIKPKQFTEEFQLVCLRGTQHQINKSLDIIRHKFPKNRFPQLDLSPAASESSVLPPQIMQLSLPEGVSVDVVVSSVVAPNHVFIQQPTHPTFPNLERMNQFMMSCYGPDAAAVPQLPRPIEVGVICAAPMFNNWYRAQVVNAYPDMDVVDIKYVDFGGYAQSPGANLRQIRSDFTTLPFQATECYLANVTTPQDAEEFSPESVAVVEELVQGRILQAEVVAHEEDGVPYVNLYLADQNRTWLLNRTLVDQGIARWEE